jgi:phenylacetic acid degradation protein paaN
MSEVLFDKHHERLAKAVAACSSREYFSAFDESPSPRVYGESAAAEGKAAFEAWLGNPFRLTTPGSDGTVATERSPYGFDLGVSYPRASDVDALLSAATGGRKAWRDAGPAGRTGICLEILERLHARIFELANAVQHTSGQAFVMAFQAGGAHALDRALESIAYAWTEMTRTPATAVWEKPGRGEPLRMEKTFTVVPRGVALVIGCHTFPTWNSWPGLFASLVTGNPVVVKPHPGAVLPLAITVQVCQEVLGEAGFSRDLVTLAAEDPADKLAATLAVRPEVRLIDFTGGNAFGDWLEANARQATVFTEKAGVNTVVIDSTDDFAAMCQNLAFSFSLYSGQMCTAPQNVYLPAAGIDTPDGVKSPADVAAGIGAALDRLLGDDARAV